MKIRRFPFLVILVVIAFAALYPAFTVRADALDNWTINQVSTNFFGLRCATYGSGRYVAAGGYSDYGVLLSSDDGQNWSLRSNGGGLSGSGLSFVESLIYAGGRFVAVGFWGGTAVSTDGVNWSVSNVNGNIDYGLYGVAYRPAGNYVAVGGRTGNDLNIFTSTDGITWTARHSTSQANATLGDVAYGAGLFVAIGIDESGFGVNDSGNIYTSGSGTTWTKRNIPGGSKVSFCNGIFIVPLSPGTNLLSPDGINWSPMKTGISNRFGKVNYANGLFMARAGNSLATSTDGSNWVQYAQTIPGTSDFASDGNRLVTVGNNFQPWGPYSANGYTYLSDVLVGVRITNSPPQQIILLGLIGRSYRIEYTDALAISGSNTWQILTTLQLTNNPCYMMDTTAMNSSTRFYRGVLLP